MTSGVMTSRTLTSVGASPSAVARTVMSRSVTMPTSRSLSQTGSGPMSSDFIFAAASWRVASGRVHSTPRVITSLTRMRNLPSLVVLLVHLLLLSFHVRPFGDLVGLIAARVRLIGLLPGLLKRALLLLARVSQRISLRHGSPSQVKNSACPRYVRSFTPFTPA